MKFIQSNKSCWGLTIYVCRSHGHLREHHKVSLKSWGLEKREPASKGIDGAERSYSPLENRGQGEELSSGKGEGQGSGEDTTIVYQAEGGEIQVNMTHRNSHKLKDGSIEKCIVQKNCP